MIVRPLLVVAAALVVAALPSGASAARTPVVLFPGYATTTLQVTVDHQTAAKGCPASGTFGDGVGTSPGTTFSQVCRDRLLTPRYTGPSRLPPPRRFALPRGVSVVIQHYGSPASAPLYTPFYEALERAGYTAGRDLRVAGYDFRLTPDLGGFLPRTKRLVERTAQRNGDRPVRLVGHSNGPLYAQYLLTHVSRAWKRRYVQGFTSIAGNLPGQGLLWSYAVTGVNLPLFTLPATPANARSSARLMALSPATWMSAADPRVFGHREIVVHDASTGRGYTPADWRRLLRDAGLRSVLPLARHYLGFVRFADRAHFPGVDVRAEKGSGLPTQVGISVPSLRPGQVVDPATATVFTRPGDDNQEDITNDAVRVWRGMRCHRFSLVDNPGVGHLALPSDPGVIRRLLADLARPRSRC